MYPSGMVPGMRLGSAGMGPGMVPMMPGMSPGMMPPDMMPEMGLGYPYGDYSTSPMTSVSKLPSDAGSEDDGSEDIDGSQHTMGPILEQMLEEFRLGDKLIHKEEKKWKQKLGSLSKLSKN